MNRTEERMKVRGLRSPRWAFWARMTIRYRPRDWRHSVVNVRPRTWSIVLTGPRRQPWRFWVDDRPVGREEWDVRVCD